MRVRKAVFPAAGWGTRFLPATKAQPKEMLPLVDKPVIQYAVEEAVEAGIEQVIIVTSSQKRAIEDHFDINVELEQLLEARGDIDMLRQIPNLRRIAVSPFANVARCAEQIGRDYVLSYRPSPADMVSYGFDEDRIRSILRRDLKTCKDCHVDITLKDVETVQADPDRARKWVVVTREVIDEIFG